MKKDELKPLPEFESDEAAENFVDTADLSEYDMSGFKPTRFFADDWRTFFDLAENPAEPTDRMVRAVKKFRDFAG